MFKKFSAIFIVMLLIVSVLTQTVMAASLEVDTGSPEFKSDTWQNNPDNDEYYPITMAFSTTPTAGVGADEVERFCACLQDGAANIEGQPSFVNGSAVNYAVFPFKETVKIDSVTWKWNNGVRQYFFILYTSIDCQNWTEIEITGNARKVNIENTWDEDGSTDGPGVECYASNPAGIADNDDIIPITFTFNQTPEAKYFRIAMFGNDGGSEDLAVTNAWFSFNSMAFEGVVVVDEPAAPAEVEDDAVTTPDIGEIAAPQPEPAPVVPSAPKVGDSGIIILAAVMMMAAVGIVIFKKKIAVK